MGSGDDLLVWWGKWVDWASKWGNIRVKGEVWIDDCDELDGHFPTRSLFLFFPVSDGNWSGVGLGIPIFPFLSPEENKREKNGQGDQRIVQRMNRLGKCRRSGFQNLEANLLFYVSIFS